MGAQELDASEPARHGGPGALDGDLQEDKQLVPGPAAGITNEPRNLLDGRCRAEVLLKMDATLR